MDTVPNGISSRRARKIRPKKASDIDINDSMSIFLGMWSAIHCLEYASSGEAAGEP